MPLARIFNKKFISSPEPEIKLKISIQTAAFHPRNVFEKLRGRSKSDAAAKIRRGRIV
jgi:DNA-binding CsgD family transcriptional regulator